MFEQLSEKIVGSLRRLKGQSRITETNIDQTLKEIRLSLLEADVNFKVVKIFMDRVKTRVLGSDVKNGISAGQQFVKHVHDELVTILGGASTDLNLRESPSVILVVGLQGTGKTTSCAKLALHIRKKLGKKPGLVPADIYRPAAIEQLKILGQQNQIPVFDTRPNQIPSQIVEAAKLWAKEELVEVIIVDTAGRLQIDDALMKELETIKSTLPPQEILLVADAMLGQQSVNVAEGFHQRLNLTGLILTKVDGDARGGAALSIRETIGIPIKLLGTGESVDALEVFHPERLASRILDMGDVVSLVEKAHEVIDQEKALKAAQRMAKNQFSVEDFLDQLQAIKKLGSFESILGMLPGMGQFKKQLQSMTPPDQEFKKIESIIRSMTIEERQNHNVLNGSRRLRIAKGSGTEVKDVNRFIKQFEESRKMMSGLMKMGLGKGKGPGFGGFPTF